MIANFRIFMSSWFLIYFKGGGARLVIWVGIALNILENLGHDLPLINRVLPSAAFRPMISFSIFVNLLDSVWLRVMDRHSVPNEAERAREIYHSNYTRFVVKCCPDKICLHVSAIIC